MLTLYVHVYSKTRPLLEGLYPEAKLRLHEVKESHWKIKTWSFQTFWEILFYGTYVLIFETNGVLV